MSKKIKVLWLTSTISNYQPIGKVVHQYNGCGWLQSAEKAISCSNEIELAVSFLLNGQPPKVSQGNVVYYPIKNFPHTKFSRLCYYWAMVMGKGIDYDESIWEYYKVQLQKVLDDFKPDIVHVWGSENYLGLVGLIAKCPVVLHIQGILNPYMNAYLPPSFVWSDFIEYSMHPMKVLKSCLLKQNWVVNTHRESTIIKSIRYHLGRTCWDKRSTFVLNPQMEYYVVDEVLRDEFYGDFKRKIPEKLTIVTTISSPPYKGYDLVLKTAKLLKDNLGMEFEWLCYGNISPNKIEKKLGIRHEEVDVKLMGVATAKQIRNAELTSTLYFHPSYIDNSPNSLCEAQLLGIPVIATNVGGIPTLVDDDKSGYLVPTNDPYQAAFCINKLFENMDLNISMGEYGQNIAKVRHDPKRIKSQILNMYNQVLMK